MTDVTTALEAVGALIGERMKYENWITALATKSDVPSHVLEKVRADYTGRLRTVLQAFAAHAPTLEAALADIQARDAVLAGQEQACRDEHAEGELRHMVGEYDDEQWDSVRVGHEALLTRLGSERESLATELAGVQRSLAATADAAQRGRTLGEPNASAPARDAVPSPRPPAVPPPSIDPVAEASVLPTAPAFSVPEPVRAPAALPFPPLAAVPVLPMSSEGRGSDDDLGFLRSTPREMSAEQNAVGIATATKSAEVSVVPASATPGRIPPAPVDAAKTLRCAECGTMNYATEWYCERCGGELAVL